MTDDQQRWISVVDTRTDLCLVLLLDYKFWALHEQELATWCDQHESAFQGMTVTLSKPSLLTLFALRWS